MSADKPVKLFIVDDHAIIINGLKAMVEDQSDIEVIGTAMNAEEALQELKNLKKAGKFPDVLLVDIRMPDMNGIELMKKILEKYPDANIAALTMFDDDEYIRSVLKLGAKGYILKNTNKDELLLGIKKIAKGGKFLSEDAIQTVIADMENEEKIKKLAKKHVKLNDKEKIVLNLIASEYTNVKIAETLGVSPRTIHAHRRILMQKLGVKNTAGLIRTAMELNLITDDLPPFSVFDEDKE